MKPRTPISLYYSFNLYLNLRICGTNQGQLLWAYVRSNAARKNFRLHPEVNLKKINSGVCRIISYWRSSTSITRQFRSLLFCLLSLLISRSLLSHYSEGRKSSRTSSIGNARRITVLFYFKAFLLRTWPGFTKSYVGLYFIDADAGSQLLLRRVSPFNKKKAAQFEDNLEGQSLMYKTSVDGECVDTLTITNLVCNLQCGVGGSWK